MEPLTFEQVKKLKNARVIILAKEMPVGYWNAQFLLDVKRPQGFIFKGLRYTEFGYSSKIYSGGPDYCRPFWTISDNWLFSGSLLIYPFFEGFNRSSEGLTNCPKCNCPTEPRRDFLTFRVREFCPRCRI